MKEIEKKRRENKRQAGYGRGVWDDEGYKEFRETLGRIDVGEEDVERIRQRMEENVRKVLREMEEGRERKEKGERMMGQGM